MKSLQPMVDPMVEALPAREGMDACGETGGSRAGSLEYCLYVVEERSSGGEG